MVPDAAERTAPRHVRVHDPASLEVIGRVFRLLNRWMVTLWRLGLGRWTDVWPAVGGRILVLEHRGRKSGREYRTPLNYTPADDAVYCVAAFGSGADWYRNAIAMDEVIVWLPRGRWSAIPADVSDSPDRVDTIRRVLLDTGLAAPAFGMYPRSMSDVELAQAAAAYRIVRLDLKERIDSGPSDLVWVWPLSAMAVAAVLAVGRIVLRRRR